MKTKTKTKITLVIFSFLLLASICGCVNRSEQHYNEKSELSETAIAQTNTSLSEIQNQTETINNKTNPDNQSLDSTEKTNKNPEDSSRSSLGQSAIDSDYSTTGYSKPNQSTSTYQTTVVVTSESKTSMVSEREEKDQDLEEDSPVESFFPALQEPENCQNVYLFKAFSLMSQHRKYESAFVSNFTQERTDSGEIRITLYTNKGIYEVLLTESAGYIRDNTTD